MLRETNIFNTLSKNELHFYGEDGLEITYTIEISKLNLTHLIQTLCSEVNLPFVININDSILQMPNDISELDNIFLGLLPEEIKLYISIKKSDIVEHTSTTNFSIFYSTKNLFNHLNNLDFFEFTEYLFSTKTNSLVWIIKEELSLTTNKSYINIVNINGNYTENNESLESENILLKYKKLSSGSFSSISIIPEQLIFPFENELTPLFDKWRTVLCLCYLASYTEYHNDQILFHFNGSQRIKLVYNLNSPIEINSIYELYNWIYGEKSEDKIKLFHNLLSTLFFTSNEINIFEFKELTPNITNTTKENFNFFIQDNIKTVIEERKKIEDLITNTGNQISIEINKITSYFIKILSGTFLSVLTTLIALLFKIDNISYISYALYLLAFVILLATIYITVFSVITTNISKKLFDNRIKEYQYLFNNEKFDKLKESIKSRFCLFIWLIIVSSALIFSLIITIICLGNYFKFGENRWIQILKVGINIIM